MKKEPAINVHCMVKHIGLHVNAIIIITMKPEFVSRIVPILVQVAQLHHLVVMVIMLLTSALPNVEALVGNAKKMHRIVPITV